MLIAAGGMDLTKEELQKMVEQLSKELELRTQKKDKYKQKYLDEKQRAATLRDDRAREVEKLHKDLELARAQLDTQILPPIHYPAVTSPDPRRQLHRSSSEIKPIVYPPVKPQQSPQSTVRSNHIFNARNLISMRCFAKELSKYLFNSSYVIFLHSHLNIS